MTMKEGLVPFCMFYGIGYNPLTGCTGNEIEESLRRRTAISFFLYTVNKLYTTH